jgi:hypothetical protein
MPLGEIIRTPRMPNPQQEPYQGGPWGNKQILPPAGGPWQPNVILPEQYLPPALQHISQDDLFIQNHWDWEMFREAALWNYVASHGGIKSCCRIPELGAPIWSQPPWQVMPSQGVRIEAMYSLPLSAISGGPPFNGTDTILGQYIIPSGYDGAINRFVCQFTGAGFDDFSGNIVWRLLINARFARNLGNVTNTYGSFQAAYAVPGDAHRVISGQTVTLIANIPAGSPVAGGVVAAGIFGWTYPRR